MLDGEGGGEEAVEGDTTEVLDGDGEDAKDPHQCNHIPCPCF